MRKLYAVATVANKPDKLAWVSPGYCVAESVEEAKSMALEEAKKLFPTPEYRNCQVWVTEIPLKSYLVLEIDGKAI